MKGFNPVYLSRTRLVGRAAEPGPLRAAQSAG